MSINNINSYDILLVSPELDTENTDTSPILEPSQERPAFEASLEEQNLATAVDELDREIAKIIEESRKEAEDELAKIIEKCRKESEEQMDADFKKTHDDLMRKLSSI